MKNPKKIKVQESFFMEISLKTLIFIFCNDQFDDCTDDEWKNNDK